MCPVRVGTIIDQIGWGFLYKDLCNGLHQEFWEEVKPEYPKILSFKSTIAPKEDNIAYLIEGTNVYKYKNGLTNPLKNMLNSLIEGIYQVQTSENDIWTVGDKVKHPFDNKNGKINNFIFCKDSTKDVVACFDTKDSIGKLFACVDNYLGNIEVSKLQKESPLFTTEDHIDIFENDEVYAVRVTEPSSYSTDVQFKVFKYVWEGNRCETDDYKWFSTKEAAEKYIYNNEKKFSVKDIEEALKYAEETYAWENTKDLFKQKLGI
jgi:hypothetical protein